MSLVAFGDLKTRALRRADHENSGFVSDAEIGDYVNEAVDEFLDLVEDQVGLEYLAGEYTFNTVAGTNQYVVGDGTDFPYMYRCLMVQYTFNGLKYPLEQATLLDLGRPDMALGWVSPLRVRYAVGPLVGDTEPARSLRFWPTPQGVHEVTVTYVPQRAAFVSPDDDATVFNYLGWDAWVVLRAAMKVLRKEESDTSQVQRELDEQTLRIQQAAARANAGRTNVITDTSALRRPSIRDLPWWADQ